MLTGKCCIGKCMALTRIPSLLPPNGHTTHKTFELKVPLTRDSVSSIKPVSSKAEKLSEIDIFLVDQAAVLPKCGLQNTDLNFCNPLQMKISLLIIK